MPLKKLVPRIAKINTKRRQTMSTLIMGGIEEISALTTSLSPSLREMTLSGLRARIVRSALSALRVEVEMPATPSEKSRREETTTTKSKIFQPLHMYGLRLMELLMKPVAIILRIASRRKRKVKMLSTTNNTLLSLLFGSFSGLSIAIVMLLAMINKRTEYSKIELRRFSFLYYLSLA